MPKSIMRRFIIQTIILVFATTGFACACPSEIDVTATTSPQLHGEMQHSDHHAAVADPQGDLGCCNDCVELNAVEYDSGNTLILESRPDSIEFESGAVETGSLVRLSTPSPRSTRSPPRALDRLHPSMTPVTFFDRMLD